jgi:phage gp36-like protein
LLSRWVMPLKQWGQDLVRFNVDIAVYLLLKQRGFNPNNPAEQSYIDNYDRILKKMNDVANNRYTPDQIQDSSGAPPFANSPQATPNTVSPTTGTACAGQTWGTDYRR